MNQRKKEILLREEQYSKAFDILEGTNLRIWMGQKYVYATGYTDSVKEIARKIKQKWGSEPFTPKSFSEIKKVLRREMASGEDHDFTVIIPLNKKALWMRDVQDRMIDNPVAIPSRKHKLMVACRLSNNKEKAEAAVLLAMHIVGRPFDNDNPIKRLDLVSLSKLIAEAGLEESKILLGLKLDSRSLVISLPYDKFKAWTDSINKILKSKRSTFKELESLVGRIGHTTVVNPYTIHFMS